MSGKPAQFSSFSCHATMSACFCFGSGKACARKAQKACAQHRDIHGEAHERIFIFHGRRHCHTRHDAGKAVGVGWGGA